MAAPRAWDLWAIDFALVKFAAGISPTEIHQYLHANGYFLLDLATDEGWLRNNERLVNELPVRTKANNTGSCYVETQPAPAKSQASPDHLLTNDRNVNISTSNATEIDQHAIFLQPATNNPTAKHGTACDRNGNSQSPIPTPQNNLFKPWDTRADNLPLRLIKMETPYS